ncbi:MAG TPA: FtsK/SpoIIIE domain-containing protein, partial [Thermoguttaceae bacterium]|nr:FtsK/SpoIIIE domain-containing protein [Thermoguttaceae bacterium]
AAARLKSIVASGSRCGVFTLMSIDTKQKLPRHFDLADLHQHAYRLTWEDESFIATHDDFGRMPLVLDELPDADRFTEIVRTVGERVKEVDRVEVPIECVLPEDGEVWAADSRGGIDLPLGRAGAMKLQHLSLGKGTSQHVLVSGKTGSGKSNMLHVLIANIALRYSPDEVHLYLVDFKKGVEFKAYATAELPHARVIAVESEREFGLSVLQRLDEELKTRGDLFRRHAVQDVASYRNANPEAVMPRILLIVDEFQELFVEDDRIAQDAALLLDRLVRQGRAFGIHVLLGSQTLGGAYSLARSTIGQMAVRIALQCSEADSHLILSEDNTVARLLTRPGEAIYNDANGLLEGNHPFQVAWMSDHRRNDCLRRAHELVQQRQIKVIPAIVFEGNVLADPRQNAPLCDLLNADSWPDPSLATQAWVGAAVAIKDPTSAMLIRQSGSNVLLVGHRDEAALGVLATMMVSLAAQHRPAAASAGAQFTVLDGTRPDSPEVGFWNRLAPTVPHGVKVVGPRNAAASVEQIDEELTRREEAQQEDAPPIFLLVFDLGRFRDLRKTEDDFGFSRFDEDAPPSTAKRFAHILREGPALGVHTLVWADTYNNVGRCLDRQNLRDFEMRITFHMNATDSSNLIDSPLASRLDVNRALLYDEGQGGLERFRPYGLPDSQWLDLVKQRLHGRV